jgi:prevent-host-death family protein
MSETYISIGQVKRDISEFLNQVAFGGERIILTFLVKPKAVIVSLEDYERIQQGKGQTRHGQWKA